MKSLQEDQISTIVNALQFKNFKAGQDLIVQGAEGQEYYLLLEGEVTVFGYYNNEMVLPVNQRAIAFKKEMPQGVGFGELALMYNDKRSANVVAKTDIKTAVLDGDVFKKIVISMAMKTRK
jgi:cAMP-dependent protein kinase regulator